MGRKKNESNSESRSASDNQQGGDFSNQTVGFALALFILVSVVGIVMYLDALELAEPKVVLDGGTASGKVSLTLLPPETPTGQAIAKVPVSSKSIGKLSIRLENKNKLQQVQ